MSSCGSLHHIFDNPLPENPTLLESLSWSQIKPVNKSIDHSSSSSSTEIIGELHFKESSQPSPSSSSSTPHVCTTSFAEIDHTKLSQKGVSGTCDINQTPSPSSAYASISTPITNHTNSHHKSSDSFSSLNSESLQLCTEGLGFESSDDVEDLKTGLSECWQIQSDEKDGAKKCVPSEEDSSGECRNRSRVVNEGEYPPPISCIGRTGKPLVTFRSYRKNGRFVLKEIRIPTQELMLHAHREDGRLKLHFVQPGEEFLEEEDDDDGEEEEDYDDVEGAEEREDNMGKENDDNVTDQVKDEKEIGAYAT